MTNDLKMRAATREQYCGPDHIQLLQCPVPTLTPDALLVRVHCNTINRTDEGVLYGRPWVFRFFTGLFKPRNAVLGTDFAGEVVAVGSARTDYSVGDRVFGFLDHSIPTQADYFLADGSVPMAKIPDGITEIEAVCSLEGAHYAINFINKMELNTGARVLVHGGTGGIGSAAFQMLQAMGIETTVVCKGDYVKRLTALGARRVINSEIQDFTQLHEQFDFVFDAVGKRTFGECKRILTDNGVYISSELGPGGENIFLALKGKFTSGQRVIFPIPVNIQASIDQMCALLSTGKFRPLIDRVYAPTQIQDAYKHMLTGQKIGNVVVDWRL
jgi:NADPH:quinone reductase-like Zn-dependent oxidoreductase